jgi:hypothetical protein
MGKNMIGKNIFGRQDQSTELFARVSRRSSLGSNAVLDFPTDTREAMLLKHFHSHYGRAQSAKYLAAF